MILMLLDSTGIYCPSGQSGWIGGVSPTLFGGSRSRLRHSRRYRRSATSTLFPVCNRISETCQSPLQLRVDILDIPDTPTFLFISCGGGLIPTAGLRWFIPLSFALPVPLRQIQNVGIAPLDTAFAPVPSDPPGAADTGDDPGRLKPVQCRGNRTPAHASRLGDGVIGGVTAAGMDVMEVEQEDAQDHQPGPLQTAAMHPLLFGLSIETFTDEDEAGALVAVKRTVLNRLKG